MFSILSSGVCLVSSVNACACDCSSLIHSLNSCSFLITPIKKVIAWLFCRSFILISKKSLFYKGFGYRKVYKESVNLNLMNIKEIEENLNMSLSYIHESDFFDKDENLNIAFSYVLDCKFKNDEIAIKTIKKLKFGFCESDLIDLYNNF